MLEEGVVDRDDGGGFQLSERSGIWIFSIIGAICVGLSGIFPLLVIPIESGPALKHGEPAKKLRLMLSFAVGSLLGDVFLHLLPEVWAHIDKNQHNSFTGPSLWVICGLMGFMVIEKVLGETEEEEEEIKECDKINKDSASNNNQIYSQLSSPSSFTSSSSSSSSSSLLSSSSQKLSPSSPLESSYSSPLSSSLLSSSSLNNDKKGGHNSNHSSIKNGKSISTTSTPDDRSRHKSGSRKIKEKTNSHDDESHLISSPETKIKISGYLNLLANVVDNFTHGLAVGTSFGVSVKTGLVTTIAILFHEIPHEVGDFAILLQSGFDKWKAAKAQVWTASGGVVGAITALSIGNVQGGVGTWLLPFTAGGFLYIALVTVVPDLMQEKQGWESLKQVVCICLGVFAIFAVTVTLH